jgi:hypothetical protein
MNLPHEVQNILEESGYITLPITTPPGSIIFEDASLIGIVFSIESLQELLSHWREMQDQFLATFARQMAGEPNKSWNAYSVFLTTHEPRAEQRSSIVEIEENLRGTRKIVGTGLVSVKDLVACLLPLLSIRHSIRLSTEDYVSRLKDRIEIPEVMGTQSTESIYKALEERK